MTFRGFRVYAAVVIAFVLSSSVRAFAADVQFGEPSYSSEKLGTYALTNDKKAFDLVFTGLEIGENGKPLPTSVVTRTFSVVIPLTSRQPNASVPINFDGVALIDTGAHGTAIFSVNGQTASLAFSPNMKDDQPFSHTVQFNTGDATEARITVVLILAQEATASRAAGFLNLKSINAETFKPKQ
jgi:hypothetical protein